MNHEPWPGSGGLQAWTGNADHFPISLLASTSAVCTCSRQVLAIRAECYIPKLALATPEFE